MPWSAVIELGKTLTITDLEGQQAVERSAQAQRAAQGELESKGLQ